MYKWFKLKDMIPSDVIMATALAVMFPGDPVWLLVVGPPGSGKTELVRAFPEGPHATAIDSMTKYSLVSGLKVSGKEETFGMIENLDGKVLLIKDLTVMLEKLSGRPERVRPIGGRKEGTPVEVRSHECKPTS